jgi:WD40 repeat protein
VPVHALALGPDGLLAAATSGVVQLWEVESRSPLPSLNTQVRVGRLRFNPDGGLLAIASWDKGVELWDTAAAALVAALPATERISDVAFSPTGQSLAIAHSSPSSDTGQLSSVAVWNILEPIGQVRFSGFRELPTALAFAPDGLLAMASWRSDLRLWCPDRCPSSSHSWEGVTPSSIAFDPEGRMVAFEADTLRWYKPPSSKPLKEQPLPGTRSNQPEPKKGEQR